jgi:hypothetical protein
MSITHLMPYPRGRPTKYSKTIPSYNIMKDACIHMDGMYDSLSLDGGFIRSTGFCHQKTNKLNYKDKTFNDIRDSLEIE